jgi:two-component system chemotaxis response regulator CheY
MSRILIVDDAVFMRNMLGDILIAPEFEVVGEAKDGVEAVEKYGQLMPDLVTMDIVMPAKSGIDATREILQIDPDARVVMISGLGQLSLVEEALNNGAVDFILKPFNADDVREKLRKALLLPKAQAASGR